MQPEPFDAIVLGTGQAGKPLALAELERCRRRGLEDLVGKNLVQEMLASREVTRGQLGHADPLHRIAALKIWHDQWKDSDFAEACENAALRDTNPSVRACSLMNLGSCYAKTCDKRIGRLLAEIVCNHREDEGVRFAAYRALYDIRGVPPWNSPSVEVGPEGLALPRNIDWSLVQSFLS